MDADALKNELADLRQTIRAERGAADLRHLRRVEAWGRACTVVGFATAWWAPNPLSVAAISLGIFARWTCVAHPVLHGAYAGLPGVPERYTPAGFARGARRFLDWFDLFVPEAWSREHNRLHHGFVNADGDPDWVEANAAWFRGSRLPRPLKLALAFALASVWKWFYYAPTTLRAWRGLPTRGEVPPVHGLLWGRSLLPYLGFHFVLVPAAFLPLGGRAALFVLVNRVLAELLTNLHAFTVIVTNHAGDDLWAFDRDAEHVPPVVRQIAGSTNTTTGGDLNDFLHGWLNYQIEHHVWPDLTLLEQRRAQPRLRALCERHGIPYVQEPVHRRLRKTLGIITGESSMRRGLPAWTARAEPAA